MSDCSGFATMDCIFDHNGRTYDWTCATSMWLEVVFAYSPPVRLYATDLYPEHALLQLWSGAVSGALFSSCGHVSSPLVRPDDLAVQASWEMETLHLVVASDLQHGCIGLLISIALSLLARTDKGIRGRARADGIFQKFLAPLWAVQPAVFELCASSARP